MNQLRFKPYKTSRDIDRVLCAIVRSAATHIPAYRELLKASNVSSPSVRGLMDLPLLPIAEKNWLFREGMSTDRLDERVNTAKCFETSTGGYTGLPVRIYMTKSEALFRRLLVLREWRRYARLPILLRVADVGSWVDTESGVIHARRGPVSIMRLSHGLPIREQIRLIAQHKSHLVSGFPTTVSVIAEQWQSETAMCSVRLIATRGEMLHESERADISNGFGARVADFYNCEETGNIASECPLDPQVLHVNTDSCVVEIVDDNGQLVPQGTEGRILVTSLYTRTMPFIRYHVGDRGAILSPGDESACACGSLRPKMTVIQGRDDDYVVMPDGQRLSPRLVAVTAKRTVDAKARELGRVRLFSKFQTIQDSPDHLTVRIVREKGWPTDLDALISSKLESLHPALRCTVEEVGDIPFEPSGKLKKVIRQIDTPEFRGHNT